MFYRKLRNRTRTTRTEPLVNRTAQNRNCNSRAKNWNRLRTGTVCEPEPEQTQPLESHEPLRTGTVSDGVAGRPGRAPGLGPALSTYISIYMRVYILINTVPAELRRPRMLCTCLMVPALCGTSSYIETPSKKASDPLGTSAGSTAAPVGPRASPLQPHMGP